MSEIIEMLSDIKIHVGRYKVRTFSIAWWTIVLGGGATVWGLISWAYYFLCSMAF